MRSINPNDYIGLHYLALDYEYLGHPELALPVFVDIERRTAGKIPVYHTILLDWGRALLLLGRWKDAIGKLEEAGALHATPATNGALAVGYAQSGDLVSARSRFEAWRGWYATRLSPPTIKVLSASYREMSDVPGYLELVNANLLDAYRKLGVPEG